MREARESYSRHGMRERLEQQQGSTAVHFFDGTERVLGRSVPTANKQSCDVGGGGGSQHPSGPEIPKIHGRWHDWLIVGRACIACLEHMQRMWKNRRIHIFIPDSG